MGKGERRYKPNAKVAPHQLRNAAFSKTLGETQSFTDMPHDFVPNRAQRRDYVRRLQSRSNRIHLVGFGLWRRPQAWKDRRKAFRGDGT